MYYYNSTSDLEFNDCISRGACSVSPNISSMQEVMFILLRQIAYYLLKLKSLGVSKEKIIFDLVSEITVIGVAKDLSESQILEAFSKQYVNLVKVRKEYLCLCKEKNIVCEDLKNLIKLSPKTSLSDILQRGNKEFLQKYKKFSFNKKYTSEIMLTVLKSVCANLICLKELKQNSEIDSYQVLEALNLFNLKRISAEKIKETTDALAHCNSEIFKLMYSAYIEFFGNIEMHEVSCSTRPNKAIMVSGSNLVDLYNLLEAVKDTEIDVYTNGNLLIAHAFSYFRNSKNLIGHFGTGTSSTILDFATFPGAILLTKNEAQNIDYLYRGRLFTTDDVAPKGVVKIINNDFTPLIESANQAKGFAKAHERKPVTVGFDEREFDIYIDEILKNSHERIYVIAQSELFEKQQNYFKKFFSYIPQSSTVISFSNKTDFENSIFINPVSNYAIIDNLQDKILKKISPEKLVFFESKCDINTFSNIINLRNSGVKDIFLSSCTPMLINPVTLREFNKLYNVKEFTEPDIDLQKLD